MMYTPKEIAEEIGINPRQIRRVYIPRGLPFETNKGRTYIHGKTFVEWYKNNYESKGDDK